MQRCWSHSLSLPIRNSWVNHKLRPRAVKCKGSERAARRMCVQGTPRKDWHWFREVGIREGLLNGTYDFTTEWIRKRRGVSTRGWRLCDSVKVWHSILREASYPGSPQVKSRQRVAGSKARACLTCHVNHLNHFLSSPLPSTCSYKCLLGIFSVPGIMRRKADRTLASWHLESIERQPWNR